MGEITFFGAFLAGLLSFLSPCVLPLIPAYLCFLGGATMDDLMAEGGIDKNVRKQVFRSAIAFVLGFSTVFIALGAGATTVSGFMMDNISVLSKGAGIVIVIFGLHYAGVFRIGFLNFEKRVHVANKPSGLIGSYIIGLAFAFGWTPCVGPILATILMVAASGDDVTYGISLLSVYAAGLGIPFLLAAFAVEPFMGFLGRFRKHLRKVELGIGILLVLTGIAIFTGDLAALAYKIQELFPALTGAS